MKVLISLYVVKGLVRSQFVDSVARHTYNRQALHPEGCSEWRSEVEANISAERKKA